MLFAKLSLILILKMFIYVLVVVQPGCSYKICFYKKGVYPTCYGEQTSLPQKLFVIIFFFKMLYKDLLETPCQVAFIENFKKQTLRGIL